MERRVVVPLERGIGRLEHGVARPRPIAHMLHIGKTVVRAIPEGARTRATAFARERRRDSALCQLDPEVIADLRLLLRPEVVALGDHLGRDLVSPWEY